jgi:hypothetical protein
MSTAEVALPAASVLGNVAAELAAVNAAIPLIAVAAIRCSAFIILDSSRKEGVGSQTFIPGE